MKLIKRHLFGGILNSLKQFLKPSYSSSLDEVPTGPTPPAPGWTKMEFLEPDVSIKPKVQLSKPSISSSELPDALSVNNNVVTPIPKSIFTPYNKFLYDAIFTDANGKPYEYKEVNTNTFNKRFLSSQEASDFLDKKRNLWKQNDFRYALRSQISKHQPGGKVLPTAPPAEERYAGGKRVINSGKEFNDSVSIRGVEAQSPWYKYPAQIVERIVHSSISPAFNDTVYAERPSSFRLMNGTIRAAGNNYYFGKKLRYSLPLFGGFFHSNYDASTPEEQKEYDTLKRRFNTAWKVSKQQGGGPIERADNTKVLHIPNNGGAVYEKTPQGIGDFVPFLGTYRAAQRIDKGEPNASYGDLIMNGAMDALGTRMIFPVLKAASKFRNIEKGLKSRGFVKGSERAHMKNGSGTDFHKRTVEVVNDYTGKPHYFEHWGEIKTVPNVDYYNVAMQPMIQSLRVPATAPFK